MNRFLAVFQIAGLWIGKLLVPFISADYGKLVADSQAILKNKGWIGVLNVVALWINDLFIPFTRIDYRALVLQTRALWK